MSEIAFPAWGAQQGHGARGTGHGNPGYGAWCPGYGARCPRHGARGIGHCIRDGTRDTGHGAQVTERGARDVGHGTWGPWPGRDTGHKAQYTGHGAGGRGTGHGARDPGDHNLEVRSPWSRNPGPGPQVPSAGGGVEDFSGGNVSPDNLGATALPLRFLGRAASLRGGERNTPRGARIWGDCQRGVAIARVGRGAKK